MGATTWSLKPSVVWVALRSPLDTFRITSQLHVFVAEYIACGTSVSPVRDSLKFVAVNFLFLREAAGMETQLTVTMTPLACEGVKQTCPGDRIACTLPFLSLLQPLANLPAMGLLETVSHLVPEEPLHSNCLIFFFSLFFLWLKNIYLTTEKKNLFLPPCAVIRAKKRTETVLAYRPDSSLLACGPGRIAGSNLLHKGLQRNFSWTPGT